MSFKTVKRDNALMTRQQFYKKIDRAIKQAKSGKGKVISTKKDLYSNLDSL